MVRRQMFEDKDDNMNKCQLVIHDMMLAPTTASWFLPPLKSRRYHENIGLGEMPSNTG